MDEADITQTVWSILASLKVDNQTLSASYRDAAEVHGTDHEVFLQKPKSKEPSDLTTSLQEHWGWRNMFKTPQRCQPNPE